ncbi:MAG: hypothetical protein ACO1NS_16290 [Daejeonella sp.]|uniref:hypothetical protein n=1 Tax=Daejeonella sp. JGW-45 TaxID=3034148 RepID=UPI0023EBA7A5|nr:hypothetical protein [Daejeonella sp. JGW-45]
MRNLKSVLLLIIFLTGLTPLFAQSGGQTGEQVALNNFVVKENLLKNNKLAIIAADENEKPLESLNGTFLFSFNGFVQELKFNNGVAVAPQPIDKSTFLYLRHKNESGTHGKLFYIYKKGDDLNPVKISWVLLVLVPLGIIILASMFRKFIIIGGIILVALLIFNSKNGLRLPTFFDTIFDGLKGLF